MKYAVIEWRDGQPYSPEFDDIYFSSEGAREESSYVFLKQNGLPEKWWHHERFIIAETGFGTGLNFVLTLKLWMETADSNACLHYHAIEKYPVAPDDIRKLSGHWPELEPYFDALLSVYPLPVEGSHSRRLFDGRVYLHLDFMDVEKALSERRLFVDAWYLDGFSPARNPGIWNDDIYRLIALNSEKGASLCTFSCAGSVRRGLAAAGFAVSKSAGFGKKREMITALLPARQTVKSKTPWYELPIPVVKNKTAIVIGAGVAGLTTAYSLVQRGWQVTVLDKHSRVAQEASGNPAGIVLPRVSADNDPDASFYSSAFLYAVQQLDALQQSTEAVFWYRQGVFSIHEKNRADKIIKRYGYPEQYMHIAAFDILPDHLAARAGKVAYFPLAGWVRPEALCKVLVNACGDSLVFKALEAVSLEQNDNGWNVRTDNGNAVVSADIVIIANGVGVCAFEQTSWLPVSSIRGSSRW